MGKNQLPFRNSCEGFPPSHEVVTDPGHPGDFEHLLSRCRHITMPSLGNCNAWPAKREIPIVYKLGRHSRDYWGHHTKRQKSYAKPKLTTCPFIRTYRRV